MVSPSESGLHGLVLYSPLSLSSGSRSLSSSASALLGTPSWSQSATPAVGGGGSVSPVPRGPILGDMRVEVKASPKRLASTRRRKRVGIGLPPRWERKGSSLAGTRSLITVGVALSALTNTARARTRWK